MYCNKADILTEFANALDISETSEKLNDAGLSKIIAEESNYIDSKIAPKYIVPVLVDNSPLAFSSLKRICIFLVCERVKSILEIKTGSTTMDQETKGYNRTPKDDLFSIIDGKLRLIDAKIATEDDGLAFGIKENDYAPFDLNKQQW